MIYFTADTHFGHTNILKTCSRPFQTVDEMNEALIAAWNSRVCDGDTVYIVGDLFFLCKDVEGILQRLNGEKWLITGNHDAQWMGKVDCGRYFVRIEQYLEIKDRTRRMTLCHYPLLTWNHAKGSYMIHGHIHSNTDADFWPLLKCRENVLNAGVDINHYQPVTFEELVLNNAQFKAEH
ncbi:MAG: hypothetical protein LUE61_05230 [Clostridiales bacterium]|nr:hypothetical protein [Clostridiales bacterium]